MLKSYKYILQNLDCANCAKKIEDEINKDKRFHDVIVNFSLLELSFKTELNNPLEEVKKIVKKIEPSVKVQEENIEFKKDKEIYRLLGAVVILIISLFIPKGLIKELMIIMVYGLLLYKTLIKAIKKIINSHNIDENFLITISAVGAYILGEHMEGVMVVLLYVIGKILEDKAVNKSRNEIKSLLDLKINKAYVKNGKDIKEIEAKDLRPHDIVIVKKGDAIPADGIVIKGETLLDTSHLTGESILQKVVKNSKVLSGSLNKGDLLEVEVTQNYYESTAYKIFLLTMNATNNKSKVETKVSKMAAFYTPAVLIIAIVIGGILPLISKVTYSDSIYRALTFLVISCPCAIAISVPLSYFAGIGASSRAKVLIKGSNFIDGINKCDTIVFDKTGTITSGSFKLEEIQIYNNSYNKKEVLNLIAMGEELSNHPLAKVILNEIKGKFDSGKVKNFKEVEGKGLEYEIGNKNIKVGSAAFVGTKKIANVFLRVDDEVIAGLIFNDNVKDNARYVLKKLKEWNIKTIMLTGDNKSFAKLVADKIDIDEYEYELLPEEKYKRLEELKKDHKVIFVGDGINDTPALALSDVGISMGEIGSNSAIEASDIVIMNDNLEGILNVLNIARKTNKIITMNLVFAILTKLSILCLATFGFANMALAVFADTGVTLITILNSLRILKK